MPTNDEGGPPDGFVTFDLSLPEGKTVMQMEIFYRRHIPSYWLVVYNERAEEVIRLLVNLEGLVHMADSILAAVKESKAADDLKGGGNGT